MRAISAVAESSMRPYSGHAALAAQPGFQVAHRHPQVLAEPRGAPRPGRHFQHLLRVHWIGDPVHLVRAGHRAVELWATGTGPGGRPGAVAAVAPPATRTWAKARPVPRIALLGHEGAHAAHGRAAAAVAGAHQQPRVGAQEGLLHVQDGRSGRTAPGSMRRVLMKLNRCSPSAQVQAGGPGRAARGGSLPSGRPPAGSR